MIEKITLDNGVRIVSEHIPYVRSASLGIWIGSGSRHETSAESGASHFIEHMVFKGTGKRTAAQIAEEMDAVGGQLNAFTTKECTTFYSQTLDTHLDVAQDVLCDMLFDSKFSESDVETERNVILEEIGMYEDAPEDLVSERLFDLIYKGNPLGRRILGKPKILQGMTGESLRAYMQEHYCPENTVIALSGSFSKEHLERICGEFSKMTGKKQKSQRPASYAPGITAKRKATEQNHFCLAFPSISFNHPDRYALQLISTILGRGMSSRLFQKVREERGLCYSIYSFGAMHDDVGVFGIYTALNQETEREAITLIAEEVKRFRDGGVSEAELLRAREQSKANVLMGLESTSARMNVLGRNELFFGKIPTADDIIAEYDAVTTDKIAELSQKVFNFSDMSISAVGRIQPREFYRELADSMA